MKKLLKLLPLLLVVLALCACSNIFKNDAPKDFEAAGLTITLTADFERDDSLNKEQDAMFVSSDAVVSVLSESFNQLGVDSSMTEDSYAQLVNLANNRESTVMHRDGYTYFQYEASEKDANYKYLAVIYKADDAFYMVQFGTLEEDFDSMLESFWSYAESVKL